VALIALFNSNTLMSLDLVTLGEALIDLPAQQSGVSLTDAFSFAKIPAGAPANVAVVGAMLGLQASFVSKVGEDAFGASIIQTFSALGVDTSHIIQDPSARTGLAFVSVQPDGTRDFLFYFEPARDLALHLSEIDLEWLETTRVFHYGSISLIAEPSRGTTLAAAAHLRTRGRAVCSYDPNLRSWLWPDDYSMRETALLGFAVADIVKISAEELQFLFPNTSSETEAIRLLLGEYTNLSLVAVTDGGAGSRGYTREGGFANADGFAVNFVDGTGAGDAYMAGLLVFLLRQGSDTRYTLDNFSPLLKDALRYANACGAIATTTLGASPQGLSDESLSALLENNP
jgi:fructokinase